MVFFYRRYPWCSVFQNDWSSSLRICRPTNCCPNSPVYLTRLHLKHMVLARYEQRPWCIQTYHLAVGLTNLCLYHYISPVHLFLCQKMADFPCLQFSSKLGLLGISSQPNLTKMPADLPEAQCDPLSFSLFAYTTLWRPCRALCGLAFPMYQPVWRVIWKSININVYIALSVLL